MIENIYSNRHGPDFDVGCPHNGTRGGPVGVLLLCSGGMGIRYLYPANRPPGYGKLIRGKYLRRTTRWSTCLKKREWERYALTDLRKNKLSVALQTCIQHFETSGYVKKNYEMGYYTKGENVIPSGMIPPLMHITQMQHRYMSKEIN